MINNVISRRSASPVAPATGFGRVIPARVRPQNSQTYYHRNQQYSIVGLTNAAGTLVERYTYSAYGTLGIYAANGTVRSSSTYANRYTYTSREWDPELRLYHFRARWYDPATGGFVSRDPLGYVDGMSLYRGYFGVASEDPYGLAVRILRNLIDDFTKTANEVCRLSRRRAVDPNSTHPADATWRSNPEAPIDTCCANVKSILQAPEVGGKINKAASLYMSCPQLIVCKCCEMKYERAWASTLDPDRHKSSRFFGSSLIDGRYLMYNGYIELCANNMTDKAEFEEYLIHELTHANQWCNRPVDWDCDGMFKRELEAYFCASQCGKGASNDEDAARDCILRALASLCYAGSPCNNDFTTEELEQLTRWFVEKSNTGWLCTFPRP